MQCSFFFTSQQGGETEKKGCAAVRGTFYSRFAKATRANAN